MITIQDLRPYITTGLFNALSENDKFDAKQIQAIITAAISEYQLFVPCFTVENEDILEKLKDIALPHIAIILSYQTLPLIPSENSDVKSLTERKYADLKKDLEGDLGGSEGSICNILKPPTPQEEVVIVGISQLQTIGRHIV